jgi:uncharacterized membrane protein YhaH (DUF805 family)
MAITNETRWRIIFEGKLLPGLSEEEVRFNLAKLFQCDAERVAALFRGGKVVMKRGLEDLAADYYLDQLRHAGALARKEADIPEPAPAPAPAFVSAEPPEPARQGSDAEARVLALDQSPFSTLAPPPAAARLREDAEDEAPAYGELAWFSCEGRLGRLRYFTWTTFAGVFGFIAMGICIGFLPSLKIPVLVVGVLALCAFVLAADVRRLHDMGLSGWWMLLFFVPAVGFVFQFVLWFKGGTPGENEYGLPPPPNSAGVKVLGVLAFAIMLVGFIGGIIGGIMASQAVLRKVDENRAAMQKLSPQEREKLEALQKEIDQLKGAVQQR